MTKDEFIRETMERIDCFCYDYMDTVEVIPDDSFDDDYPYGIIRCETSRGTDGGREYELPIRLHDGEIVIALDGSDHDLTEGNFYSHIWIDELFRATP